MARGRGMKSLPRRPVVPGRGQEGLPVDVPAPPVRDVVALLVNRRPQTAFTGQQAFPTDAFVIDSTTVWRLLDRGAAELEAIVHPVVTSGAMLDASGVNRWIVDIDKRADPNTHPVVMDHLEKEARPARRALAEAEEEENRRRRTVDPGAKLRDRYAKQHEVWWTLVGPRRRMLAAISSLDRYLVTSKEARQDTPIFTFVDASVRPDESLAVYALSDDYSFGVLSSEAYRAWLLARRTDARTGVRRRGAAAWSSFPWPQAPRATDVADIAELAHSILAHRETRLAGGATLAHQYGLRDEPQHRTLANLTAELDRAVLSAYGISDVHQVVDRLEALNRDIAADPTAARGPGCTAAEARKSEYRVPRPAWPPVR
jgi:hypothetical protein